MAKRYSENFEPLLREQETARLFGAGLPQDGLDCRCVVVGSMPELMIDFGALTAVTWLNDQQSTNMNMNKLEFAQLRMRVVDDMMLRLRNSPPVQQWRTQNATFSLPQFPIEGTTFLQEWYWRSSEFLYWEDHVPAFSFYSLVTTTVSRVLFSGWRFRVEKISERGKFDIWLSDWPSQTVQRQ